MASLEQIQAKMKQLEVQAEALLAKKAQAAVDQIRDIMLKHGLTTEDIEAKAKAKREAKAANGRVANRKLKPAASAKGKLPPKYINPKTGETWSGHARPPLWIANVKDRRKFLIAGASAPVAAKGTARSKAAAKPVSKAASKGKLPPKYRDPKTGATWSGHARPPQWIAGVKDRTRFLIAGAADGGAVGNGATASKAKAAGKSSGMAKKAATKKVVAKKAAAKKVVAKKVPVAKKVAAEKAVSVKAPAKKASAKKAATPVVKKAPAKKVPRKSAAVTAPAPTVEPGAGS